MYDSDVRKTRKRNVVNHFEWFCFKFCNFQITKAFINDAPHRVARVIPHAVQAEAVSECVIPYCCVIAVTAKTKEFVWDDLQFTGILRNS